MQKEIVKQRDMEFYNKQGTVKCYPGKSNFME